MAGKFTADTDTYPIPYRLWQPELDAEAGATKYPLVIALHGAGLRGDDNAFKMPEIDLLTSDAVQTKHPAFVLVPQCPAEQKWVNTDWTLGAYSIEEIPLSSRLQAVMQMLERILKEQPIDRTRIYIIGHSMGGYGTWDLVTRNPQLFAAAIPICGGGDPAQAEKIKHVALRTFHGSLDETVPPHATHAMVDAVKKVGGNIQHTEYPNVAHNSWGPACQEPDLMDWFFAQQR